MKTKHSLILLALAASIGINVYSFSTVEKPVSPCDDSKRYGNEVAGGGKEMAKDEIDALVNAYREVHHDNTNEYKTTGFILSKRIFDELFKDANANALSLNLVEEKGQLNLAIKSIVTTKTGIEKKAGTGLYVLQSFCPDDCSAW